ncbi:hypothetical protein C6P42_002097 [Pichia californica]|nr:hypothetical protein C6P42_002097 [[Candida] californica]
MADTGNKINEQLASSIDKKKQKKTKSRNGCVTCKKRRLKCDETKPLCQNCIKKGIVCGGYAINFKWRDFSETSTSLKVQPEINTNIQPSTSIKIDHKSQNQHQNQHQFQQHQQKQKHMEPSQPSLPNISAQVPFEQHSHKNHNHQEHPTSVNNPLQKALEEATLSVTGKSTQEIAIANALIASGKNPELAAAVASTLNGLIDNNEILDLVSKKKLESLGKNDDQQPSILTSKSNEQQKQQQQQKQQKQQKQPKAQQEEQNDMINIHPNKLVNNTITTSLSSATNVSYSNNKQTNNTSTSLLHSLADIASKVPASPIGPLSPFNEPFPSDAFIQKHRQKSFTEKSNNNLKNSNNSSLKKESPLNLFKESPQTMSSVYSPTIFPKSPGISSLLTSYQSNNIDNNNNNNSISNIQTPKFDDLDSLQQFVKLSPSIDSYRSNLINNQHPSIMSPPIFNLLSAAGISNNNEFSQTVMSNYSNYTSSSSQTNNEQIKHYQNHTQSPVFEIDTPKPLISTPNSPYTAMLSYINSTQIPEKTIKSSIIKEEEEEEKLEEEEEEEEEATEETEEHAHQEQNPQQLDHIENEVIEEINNHHQTMTNNNQLIETPNFSGMNSPLDIFDNPNRAQLNLMLMNKPINLHLLHLSDENLSTLVAFDQYTCGIMSIKNGPTENPWRTFLLPMSIDHPVVRSALLAMTCFHVARGDPTIRARGVRYMKDAIVTLVHSLSSDNSNNKEGGNNNKQKKIKNGSSNSSNVSSPTQLSSTSNSSDLIKRTPPDVALATCIALAMGEAWDRHISTGIAHLKGAKSMIIRVLNKLEGKRSRNKKRRSRSNSSNYSDMDSQNMSGSDSLYGSSTDSKIEDLKNDDKYNTNSNNNTNNNSNNDNNENQNNFDNDENNLQRKKLPKELQFLVNAWMYFDVLARMTSENDDEFPNEYESDNEEDDILSLDGESDESGGDSIGSGKVFLDDALKSHPLKRSASQSTNSSKKTKLSAGNRNKKRVNENNSSFVIAKFRRFNLEDGDKIDPLLGVAQTLFPIMSDVASLIEQVRRIKSKGKKTIDKNMKTPLRLISKAVELKNEIERWKIPSLVNVPNSIHTEDPTFDLNAAVATAEAYRYSVLLYIHQAVPEVPSQSSHSLAENVMMLLASVPVSSRTSVTHLFPLFVASCEATPGEEREWARERWTGLSEKMWIGTIERAWEVVKEVWARKDALAGKKYSKIYTEKESSENFPNIINPDDKNEVEYNKVKRRISMVIHGNDNNYADDEDNKLGSWTHWTTVMKEWGWEVLLA